MNVLHSPDAPSCATQKYKQRRIDMKRYAFLAQLADHNDVYFAFVFSHAETTLPVWENPTAAQ